MECTSMTLLPLIVINTHHKACTKPTVLVHDCFCSVLVFLSLFCLFFFFCFLFFKSRKEKQQEILGGCSPVMPGAHYGLPNIKSQSRYKLARRRRRRRRQGRQGRDSAPAARHRHPFSYAVSHTEFRTSPPSLLRHTYTYVYMVLHMYTTEY